MQAKRHMMILELLRQAHAVSIEEFKSRLNVSEMTVRRDLLELEKQGLLKRTFGGAISTSNAVIEPPYRTRGEENKEEKVAVGMRAAEFVEDGDCIYLDYGTTAERMATFLRSKRKLTVVTASTGVAAELFAAEGVTVVITGGVLRHGEPSLVGPLTERTLRDMYFHKAFIGVAGIEPASGITEYNLQEAEAKRIVIERAKQVFLIADHAKFGRVAFVRIGSLRSGWRVITDSGLDGSIEAGCQQLGVEIIRAQVSYRRTNETCPAADPKESGSEV